jgi:hypothetical protein
MTDTMAWTVGLFVAGIFLTVLANVIVNVKNNAWVKQHAAASKLADLAGDICNSALALLSSNPALTPAQAAAWALNELKASAPDAITAAGSLATGGALGYMVTRKLVTAAQAAPISDASNAVIAALAPSATTARVTPVQTAAVTAAVASTVPDLESIVAAVVAKINATLPPPSAPVAQPVVTVAAPTPTPVAAAPVAPVAVSIDPTPTPVVTSSS